MIRARCDYYCLVISLFFGIVAYTPGHAHADTLPLPTGKAVLVVSGKLARTNVDRQAHLDIDMLRSMPVTELVTTTPWETQAQTFTGVRVNALLDYLGSDSTMMVAIGLDDYRFTLKNVDFDKFPVIIAYQQNGQNLSLRQLGPLRIVFPYTDYPELDTGINEFSAVWQLVQLQLL